MDLSRHESHQSTPSLKGNAWMLRRELREREENYLARNNAHHRHVLASFLQKMSRNAILCDVLRRHFVSFRDDSFRSGIGVAEVVPRLAWSVSIISFAVFNQLSIVSLINRSRFEFVVI